MNTTSPDLRSFLVALRRYDESRLDELHQLAQSAIPEERTLAAEIAWAFLTTVDGRSCTDICLEVLKAWIVAKGQTEVEQKILLAWSQLSEQAHVNFCYAAADPNLLPTDFAMQLFQQPNNGLHEQKTLLAGLAQSMAKRCQQDATAGSKLQSLIALLRPQAESDSQLQEFLNRIEVTSTGWTTGKFQTQKEVPLAVEVDCS